jgi:uncharacterized protein
LPEGSPNRLAKEKSPYLLKHALNPVDWYTWGPEAHARSKNDNKPIFLSIGYSTCHWCTVMERESFEDRSVAAFINKNFIPIKVDREERPEVDAYYMGAVQAMTGGGGWPLSVFLTPDLKPFYGGTYFPPEPRYGMPSFMQVLEFVSNLWKDRKDEVNSNTEQVLKALSEQGRGESGELKNSPLEEGYADLLSSFDSEHGGFGTAPKFPLPSSLAFLLRYHFRTGNQLALKSVLRTLDEMMAGGIRDHLGGGFHRYSTDRVWLVPHFEKMLYDNALLAAVYTEAYRLTGRAEYREVVRETLGWMAGEMRDTGGGFYSAQDADTEQGEGFYYSWTPGEVIDAAGPSDGAVFNKMFGVTSAGNFGGRSLLHLDPGDKSSAEERKTIERAKRSLYQTRLRRARPAIDDKILTSWNGLAISAFASAGAALKDQEMTEHAAAAARFILEKNQKQGRLLRRHAGGESALPGTIEDYAFFVQGLIDLFESDPDPSWLMEATRLSKVMVDVLEDKQVGGFFFTSESELPRLKESYDGPTPSGNSVAALDLARLAELTGDEEFRKAAERTIKAFAGDMEKRPSAHTQMLAALDLLLNGAREVVITAPTEKEARPMVEAALGLYAPDLVLVTATSKTYPTLARLCALLEGREPRSEARAYVCRNFACKVPVDSVKALAAQLASR